MVVSIPSFCAAACRLLSHRLVFALSLVVFSASLSNQLFAAGCSHETENSAIGLDPFGKPLASNVVKVYDGGEFKYYVLPTGNACRGPNCKGVPPTRMSSVPVVINSEPTDLSFLFTISPVGHLLYCDRFVSWPTSWPVSIVLDGLLRPPTA